MVSHEYCWILIVAGFFFGLAAVGFVMGFVALIDDKESGK